MGEGTMKRFGFIFARGGSKGLPGKNLMKLGGIPLICRAVQSGLDSGMLDRILVSTDDPAIAETARKCGAEVPFLRPAELARDDSPEWAAWQHAISQVEPFDVFVSLPCTAPLRTGQDVRACIERYHEGDCEMVVTTRDAARHPAFNMVALDKHGHASTVMSGQTITRRQDAPPVYDMTTVAYVGSPEFILNHSSLFEGRVGAVNIPAERAVDIDTELDFAFAQFLLERAT